jgi:kynurenine formamidase
MSGPFGANGFLANEEFVAGQLGQVGTQFDGPGHVGVRMTMADGTPQNVFYNGVTSAEMSGGYGLRKLGVENVKPYVTRGVLIDIAGSQGVATLPSGYEVTMADVRGALGNAGIEEARIEPGHALFFNYGWSRLWSTPARYAESAPGIGLEVARWVIEKQAALVGSDAPTTEVERNPNNQLVFPVHQELIAKHGIFNIENMTFEELVRDRAHEFLFVFTPLRLRGATGSPGRPIAIR